MLRQHSILPSWLSEFNSRVPHVTDKQKEWSRNHYQNNKQYYYERNKRLRQEKSDYIRTQKEVPCTDCKQEFPHFVLEFDHTQDKKYNVSEMTMRGWAEIKREIAKCEVVCANCHKIRTWERQQQSGV